MPHQAFIVDEAIISIFPVDANGNPMVNAPIWLGECVTGLRIADTLKEVADYPTGAPYGKVHHVDESHEISIQKLWLVDIPMENPTPSGDIGVDVLPSGQSRLNNGNDYRLQPDQEYVMSIVWQDKENPSQWYWRVYYGVTDCSFELSGNGIDGEFGASHLWRAQYMVN